MQTYTCHVCGKETGPDNPPAKQGTVQLKRRVKTTEGKTPAFYVDVRLAAFEAPAPELCQQCLLNAIANPAPEPPALSIGIGTDASNLPIISAPTGPITGDA